MKQRNRDLFIFYLVLPSIVIIHSSILVWAIAVFSLSDLDTSCASFHILSAPALTRAIIITTWSMLALTAFTHAMTTPQLKQCGLTSYSRSSLILECRNLWEYTWYSHICNLEFQGSSWTWGYSWRIQAQASVICNVANLLVWYCISFSPSLLLFPSP